MLPIFITQLQLYSAIGYLKTLTCTDFDFINIDAILVCFIQL